MNGVPQKAGEDYELVGSTLVFARSLAAGATARLLALGADGARDRRQLRQERHDRRRLHGRRPAAGGRPPAARTRSPNPKPALRFRAVPLPVWQHARAACSRGGASCSSRPLRSRCTSSATSSATAAAPSAALAAQGHGYQNSLAPWVVLLARARARRRSSCGSRGRRRRSRRGARRRPFAALFGLAWALLLATYAVPGAARGRLRGRSSRQASPASSATAAGGRCRSRRVAAALDRAAPDGGRRRRRGRRAARVARGRPDPRRLSSGPSSCSPVRRSPLAGRVAGRAPPAPGLAAA